MKCCVCCCLLSVNLSNYINFFSSLVESVCSLVCFHFVSLLWVAVCMPECEWKWSTCAPRNQLFGFRRGPIFFGLFGFDFLPPLIPFLWKFHFSLWQLRQRSFKIGFNLKREEKNQFHLIFINYRRKTVIDARMKFIKRFVDSRTNSNSSNWTTNGVSSCNRDFRISEMATAIKIKLFHSMEMYWLGMAVESRCIIPNCR